MDQTNDCHSSNNSTRRKMNVVDLFQSEKVVKICAPMVRYSKLAFRTLVRRYDCDLMFTPMIVSNSFVKSVKARDSEFTTNAGDHPLIVQFAASNAKDLADATEFISPYANGVDLNCGCPQRWAMAEGYGAHLINKPGLIKDMVRQTKSRICQPDFSFSIKIRLHKDIRETVDLCQKAEHAGISWVTVHGRTVQQRTEPVDYNAIKIINDSISIPVVANGDIKFIEDVKKVHKKTGVKGVMAARGVLQNPAMYAGYDNTPLQCVQDWVDISIGLGTPFPCFHYHLIAMMERITSKPEKKLFNTLHSSPAVLDFLKEHYDVQYNGQQQSNITDQLDGLRLDHCLANNANS